MEEQIKETVKKLNLFSFVFLAFHRIMHTL